MASSRPYVPSSLLLRSLLRPLPQRCPSARPFSATSLRAKRPRRHPKTPRHRTEVPGQEKKLPKGALNESGISAFSWVEADAHGRVPEREIMRIDTPEKLQYLQETARMMDESEVAENEGREYEGEAELRRRLLDEMIKDPNFADLQEGLVDMKKDWEERQGLQKAIEDFEDSINMGIPLEEQMVKAKEAVQNWMNDPKLANCREQLMEFRNKLGGFKSFDDPKFLQELDKVRLIPEIRDKLGVPRDAELPNEILAVQDEENVDVDKLMASMSELLKGMGGKSGLEDELEAIRNEDLHEEGEDFDQDDFGKGLIEDHKQRERDDKKEVEDGAQDPNLEALVDKIMEDPDLMQKLAIIKGLVARRNNDLLQIGKSGKSAPDPKTLDKEETTNIAAQLKVAENDPEHIIALRRLRINLLPPYNISPQARSLNEALKLAYLGANDDIRRILWKAYFKAREVPGLLSAIPDDAWDLIWYSQAVDWGSNANRQNHLKMLQLDLASVGKDGPPTKTAAENEE